MPMAIRDPSTHQAAFTAVSSMEGEVGDVRGFADALICMGQCQTHIPPKAVYVLGTALEDLAGKLQARFDEAFKAVAEAGR
jgi:hypothetical protein